MIVKVRTKSGFEYVEIPTYLEEEYHNDLEIPFPEGYVPTLIILSRWAHKKGIKVVFAEV